MREYIYLQFTLINRRLKDWGLHPAVGYLLSLLVFTGFSVFLFYKSELAAYIYVLFPIFFSFRLSEAKRNDFLKTCFSDTDYKAIRVVENLMIAFPFVVFLLYKQCFLMPAALIGIIVLSALGNLKTDFTWVIPTPFSKRPFEFTVGFRNTFYLFIASYCLMGIAVAVDNFNLGVFALIVIMATAWTYYVKPENDYYVWIYAMSPVRFLIDKMKTALLYSFLLSLPVLLLSGFFYRENAGILLLFFTGGYLFLMLMIVAKYAAYPEEINLPQAVLIILCFSFPPFLILVIPYLFYQSTRQLSLVLK
jgi:hypothetical protein